MSTRVKSSKSKSKAAQLEADSETKLNNNLETELNNNLETESTSTAPVDTALSISLKEAEIARMEAEIARREAELAEKEKKYEQLMRIENLRNKKKNGFKLTDLELFEEGSTPHNKLRLYGTHRFVPNNNCRSCGGGGWCYGERGPAGYGNEEWKCSCGKWVPITEK